MTARHLPKAPRHRSLPYTISPNVATAHPVELLEHGELESVFGAMDRHRDPYTPLLKEWLTHPDERVVIAALRIGRYEYGVIPYLREVVERAALALQLGYLWTPLLDEVARRAGIHLEYVLRLALDRLMVWTAREGGVEDLRVMLKNYDSPMFLEAVASRGPHFTPELVSRLFRNELVCHLVFNPYMSPKAMEQVIDHIVDYCILARWSSKDEMRAGLEQCISLLDLLVRSGYRLKPNHVAKVAERLPRLRPMMNDWTSQLLERLLRQHLHESLKDMTRRQRRGVAGLLLSSDSECRLSTLVSL